ncbi:MAG: hypothetical protein IKG93_01430, partial [Clostridiales bacterium]|nr:hypothetical protein [Clostridiales bacterium]
PTAFFACFSVILSRKMKIADFRLTFSKKEFQNGAICKSFFAISTFATYLPHHTAQKALAPRLPAYRPYPTARKALARSRPPKGFRHLPTSLIYGRNHGFNETEHFETAPFLVERFFERACQPSPKKHDKSIT